MAADSNNLYFVTYDSSVTRFTLQSMPISGGSAKTLTTADRMTFLLQDANNLYYFGSGDSLVQVAKSTGQTRTITTSASQGLTIPKIYGGFIYWTSFGTLYSANINNGTVSTVIPDWNGGVLDFVLDGSLIYYLTPHGLYTITTAGGSNAQVWTPAQAYDSYSWSGYTSFMGADSSNIYFVWLDHTLYSMPKNGGSGGTPTALYNNPIDYFWYMTVQTNGVFWAGQDATGTKVYEYVFAQPGWKSLSAFDTMANGAFTYSSGKVFMVDNVGEAPVIRVVAAA